MIVIMSEWRDLFAGGTRRSLADAEVLFRRDDPVQTVFLVASGTLALERGLPDGAPLVLALAGPGQMLAEASLFARHYHCDAVARAPATLLALDRAILLDRLKSTPDAALGLLTDSAHEVQRLRARIEILRLKRVSDRLAAWTALYGEPAPGAWVQVAEAIGVTPEALYRERARQRKAGQP